MTEHFPLVSLVIPVFNESKRLPDLLKRLADQTYPMEKIQFCFVDNNSTDDSAQIIRENGYEIFFERNIQNADAARNRALIAAHGEIIAFTDADCLPAADWIETGVKHLQDCDLLAGRIETFSRNPESPAELYDKLTNLRHDLSVSERSVAFTANLFIKRYVFEKVGFFKPFCGGDHELTSQAVAAGYRLSYSPHPTVRHPARNFRELMAKAFRIGKEKGRAPMRINALQASSRPHFHHLRPKQLRASIKSKNHTVNHKVFWRCYATGLLYLSLALTGYVIGKCEELTFKCRPAFLKQKTIGLGQP